MKMKGIQDESKVTRFFCKTKLNASKFQIFHVSFDNSNPILKIKKNVFFI